MWPPKSYCSRLRSALIGMTGWIKKYQKDVARNSSANWKLTTCWESKNTRSACRLRQAYNSILKRKAYIVFYNENNNKNPRKNRNDDNIQYYRIFYIFSFRFVRFEIEHGLARPRSEYKFIFHIVYIASPRARARRRRRHRYQIYLFLFFFRPTEANIIFFSSCASSVRRCEQQM